MLLELINLIGEKLSDRDLGRAAKVDRHWYKSLKRLLQFRHRRKRRLWTSYLRGNDLLTLDPFIFKFVDSKLLGMKRAWEEFKIIYKIMEEVDKNKAYPHKEISDDIFEQYSSIRWWIQYYPCNLAKESRFTRFVKNINGTNLVFKSYGQERRETEARAIYTTDRHYVRKKYEAHERDYEWNKRKQYLAIKEL